MQLPDRMGRLQSISFMSALRFHHMVRWSCFGAQSCFPNDKFLPTPEACLSFLVHWRVRNYSIANCEVLNFRAGGNDRACDSTTEDEWILNR